jgi:hypothetical protein
MILTENRSPLFGLMRYLPSMPVLPRLTAILLIGLLPVLAAGAARAADPPHHVCLSKAEQRAAVASHRAVSLAQAVKAAKAHYRRSELLRARLCRQGEGLAYELTLLGHKGKVKRAAVDAENGRLIRIR